MIKGYKIWITIISILLTGSIATNIGLIIKTNKLDNELINIEEKLRTKENAENKTTENEKNNMNITTTPPQLLLYHQLHHQPLPKLLLQLRK